MRKHLPALLAVCAGVLLGLWALLPPRPAGLNAPGFSALRARRDIDVIAKAPHTAWDPPSLVPVRDHIRGRLAAMGLTVTTNRYGPIQDAFGHTCTLENLAASIPGRSGSYLLLVSHFDSAPKKRPKEEEGSCGAGDDGYGVATMLEIAGLLTASKAPLENGIRFLFTDGEETGLLGARAEMERNLGAYQDVNLVINLEARGIKGPVVMFETGRNNLASLRLYRRAHRAFAYSFAVDVYRRMPNGTDLTEFINKGFSGLNFAVLEDLSYYHTPRDNPANISLGSLQHYGEQVLPVVRAYAADARYGGREAFVSRQDMVYFSWLPGLFFSWSRNADRLLSGCLAVLILAWAGWTLATLQATLAGTLRWLLVWAGLAVASLAAGLGTSFLLAKAMHATWRLTYLPKVPHERLLTWGMVLALALVAYVLGGRRAHKGRMDRAPLLGALGLNLVLLLVLSVVMPGGTFLFSMPLLVCFAAVVLADVTQRPVAALIGVVFTVSLFVPVLHLFSLALTTGALGILLLIAAFPLALAGSVARCEDGLGRR